MFDIWLKDRRNDMNIDVPETRASGLNILLVLALAASLSLPGAYTIDGAIFAVIGLFYLSKRLLNKAPLFEPDLVGKLPLFFIAFALVGAAIRFWHHAQISDYEMYIPFLWAPLIVLAVLDGRVDRRFIWLGCLLGAIFACLAAAYQSVFLGIYRPGVFAGSPITFGNNALLLGSIALVGRHDPPFGLRKPVWLTFAYIGFLFGLGASLISQSKGGWPLIPVVLFWFLLEDFRRASRTARFSFLVAAVAFICLVPFTPLKKDVDRVEDAGMATLHWFQTGQIADLSAAPRLVLWQFGWTIWPEKPWLGHGREGIVQRMHELTAENKLDPQIDKYGLRVLHNEPLQLLAEQGLLGLLGWLTMFVASLVVFTRAFLQPARVEKLLGQAGLITVIASLIFGLTDMNLLLNANRQIFVFLVMAITALIIAEQRTDG
jgi:O-antigen ligase